MKILGVIPSRYDSSRFPGKPLADIAGKSMIQRVFEQCQKSKSLSDLVVATDDDRIFDHVRNFGGNAVMTSTKHTSGTDRCHEALHKLGSANFNYVINIQGDEPFIQPIQIDKVAALLKGDVSLASLAVPTKSLSAILDKDKTHVVFKKDMNALYFSREPIPHIKNTSHEDWTSKSLHYIHLGIYGYSKDVLKEVVNLPKSSLEVAESLEQLRWMENGYKIKLGLTNEVSYGIDRPEDIEKVLKMHSGKSV